MEANKKWLAIPKETRRQLMKNVFCAHCLDMVAIEHFTIENDQFGIVLKGECKNCGHEVARLIETE